MGEIFNHGPNRNSQKKERQSPVRMCRAQPDYQQDRGICSIENSDRIKGASRNGSLLSFIGTMRQKRTGHKSLSPSDPGDSLRVSDKLQIVEMTVTTSCQPVVAREHRLAACGTQLDKLPGGDATSYHIVVYWQFLFVVARAVRVIHGRGARATSALSSFKCFKCRLTHQTAANKTIIPITKSN